MNLAVGPPPGRSDRWLLGALGLALALAVGLRLGAVLPEVPGRHAPLYDAARRTMDDVDAADALRRGDLGAYALHLVGRQTWPTVRLSLAAPLHALAGPSRALAVEQGLSLAFTAALFAVLVACARAYARTLPDTLAVLAIAAPLLLGNRDLLQQAVNGMLEVPEALFTVAAASAWMVSRDDATSRPWATAVLGNLLFHTKFQYGLMFAAAVLGLESLEAGKWRVLPRVGAALLREVRRPTFLLLAVASALLAALAFRVVAAGGYEGDSVLGFHYSIRTARLPVWLSAVALFTCAQLALWRSRATLRPLLGPRLQFWWLWLLTPMAAWLLVPYTWRLEILVDSVRFDSLQISGGLLERLAYYPRAAWEGWFPPGAAWLALGLVTCTGIAAWRSPFVRRLVVPFATLAGVELAMLTLANRANYQPRLTVNLAPLLALAAGAWMPLVVRPRLKLGLAVALALLLGAGVWHRWRRPALVATLSQGFEVAATGDQCRAAAIAFPLQRGVLINETDSGRVQVCNLWVKLLARERGAQVGVRTVWTEPTAHEVLVLEDGTRPRGSREGLIPRGEPQQFGPLRAQRFSVDGR